MIMKQIQFILIKIKIYNYINMGSQVSVQQNEQLEKAVTNVINKQNNKSSTTVECNSDSTQKISIGPVTTAKDCTLNIGQNTDAKIDCLLKSVNNLKAEQASQMENDLKAATQQMLDQKMKDLNLAQSQVSDIKSKANIFIENNAQNIINSSINNTLKIDANDTKEIEVKNINCQGGTINLSQTGIINSMAKSSVSTGIEQFNTFAGKNIVDLLNKQESKQTMEGLSLPSILGIIGGIVLFIIIILIIIYSLTSKSTPTPEAYENMIPLNRLTR